MLFASLLTLAATPPRVLIVGGGPSKEYNQAAIESNVRYVARVLPGGSPLRVLFADGDGAKATVRYTPSGATEERDDRYRKPRLPRLDGPARATDIRREIAALATGGASPILLYFTGHGSLAPDLSPDTSEFDLWQKDRITVPELGNAMERFSKATPVVLLMVQCHAGGFAKLLFRRGDPAQPTLDNRFCGFYASVESRPAAGCTPSIDEADYHDFTGYFVAALSGLDRLGRPSVGADYDHDGKVGMNEAFCWSLVHDDSIDTPVCTSDEFLRDVVKTSDATVFATPYPTILGWASAAQRAALRSLYATLTLVGPDPLPKAYARYAQLDDEDDDLTKVKGLRFLRLAKSVVLGHSMAAFPNPAVRRRYETLVRDEAANPFRP